VLGEYDVISLMHDKVFLDVPFEVGFHNFMVVKLLLVLTEVFVKFVI